jgi:hypothetical protein
MFGLRVLELLDDWFVSTRIPELARNEGEVNHQSVENKK